MHWSPSTNPLCIVCAGSSAMIIMVTLVSGDPILIDVQPLLLVSMHSVGMVDKLVGAQQCPLLLTELTILTFIIITICILCLGSCVGDFFFCR